MTGLLPPLIAFAVTVAALVGVIVPTHRDAP
jgi:hypothetical protein